MADLSEILDGAEEGAKDLARDTVLRVGDWIEANVRAHDSLDDVVLPSEGELSVDLDGMTLDNALARLDAVRESLAQKLEAKEKGGEIAEAVLLGALRIVLLGAISAL